MILLLLNWLSVLIVGAVLVYFAARKRAQGAELSQDGADDAKANPGFRFQLLAVPNTTISRGQYLLYGAVLFAIKYNLDRAVAAFGFHRSWTLLNYLDPLRGFGMTASEQGRVWQQLSITQDGLFYVVLALMALPFIWAGVVLTIQRLRDLDLAPGWALLFFVPFINFLMFAMLCMLPNAAQRSVVPNRSLLCRALDGIIPKNEWGSAVLGVFITGLLAAVGVMSATHIGVYGWGLFLGLPYCLGLISVLIYGYHQPRKLAACLLVSALAVTLAGLVILVLAFEGVICLLMAAPIGMMLGLMGGATGYALQARPIRAKQDTLMMLATLLLSWPLLTGAESRLGEVPPSYAVASVMDINAPPETVWNNVVTFSQLPEPTEWLFHTGIAYPIRAEIQGRGVGAVRHCIFSTGEFVEPIQVWDEPHRLGFGVRTMPMPMHEWSYKEIHPPHLDAYLQVTHGEFRLEPLPGNRTRLIGTTWYSNKVWPSMYWKVWSDGIIHTIHMRVLRHIKNLSETIS